MKKYEGKLKKMCKKHEENMQGRCRKYEGIRKYNMLPYTWAAPWDLEKFWTFKGRGGRKF